MYTSGSWTNFTFFWMNGQWRRHQPTCSAVHVWRDIWDTAGRRAVRIHRPRRQGGQVQRQFPISDRTADKRTARDHCGERREEASLALAEDGAAATPWMRLVGGVRDDYSRLMSQSLRYCLNSGWQEELGQGQSEGQHDPRSMFKPNFLREHGTGFHSNDARSRYGWKVRL